MSRDVEPTVTIEAIGHVAEAVVGLLAGLRATDDGVKRAEPMAEFEARLDDLRVDLWRRRGLGERRAADVLARALGHVGEFGRAAAGRNRRMPH